MLYIHLCLLTMFFQVKLREKKPREGFRVSFLFFFFFCVKYLEREFWMKIHE